MLPAKEQRAVPIGGASLVSFKGIINDAEESGVSVPDLSGEPAGQRRLEPLYRLLLARKPPTIRRR
jgi:hypothetical protein